MSSILGSFSNGLSYLGNEAGSAGSALKNFILGSDQNAVNGAVPFKDSNILAKAYLALGGPESIRNYDAEYNLQKLGQSLANGEIDQGQYLKGLAAYSPNTYSKVALAQTGIDQPADVRSWLYRMGLPDEQQKQFDSFRRTPQWLNTGGAFVNPLTNGLIPITPKPDEMPDFKKQQAAATESGKIEGGKITDAKVGLGDFLAATENQLSVIDQMIGNKDKGIAEHPGLSSAVGGIDSLIPSVSDKTLDFEALLEQARSGAFLDSIQKMQGFGALSNEEGKAATAAATRMKSRMSEEGFKKAAKEYRDIVTKGMERMQKKASLSSGTPSAFDENNNQNLFNTEKPTGAENAAAKLDAKFPTKTIGNKTYINKDGKWYEQ